jgi:hypothetical protein
VHAPGVGPDPDAYVIEPDASGQFCVLFEASAPAEVRIGLRAHEGLYDAPETLLRIDRSKPSLTLSFSPEPPTLQLDRQSHVIYVDGRVDPAFSAEDAVDPIDLELSYAEGSNPRARKVVARAKVRPGERAEFDVLSSELARPGPGRLIVRFAGSDRLQAAERSAIAPRVARVTLSLANGVGEMDPDSGAELDVRVLWGEHQPVSSGSVEARYGETPIGMGKVVNGMARVHVHPISTRQAGVTITFDYLQSEPWWLDAEPLSVTLSVAARSGWRGLPWIVGALGVALWVLNGWRRPKRQERLGLAESTEATPSGQPTLEVLEAGAERTGWTGNVVDAHDGHGLSGARLAIIVPSFEGDGVVSEATSEPDGSFELLFVDQALHEGARLEVSAEWHSSLARELPACGKVRIQLVSRRRALLERLVQWARRRGRPWVDDVEPTPGRLARVAEARHAPDVARWADEVERAAYGPDPLDAEREDAIRKREPAARTPRGDPAGPR